MKVEKLLNLVAPHYCLGCGEEGSLICSSCEIEKVFEKMQTCYRCNSLSQNYLTCRTCRSSTVLNQVWIAAEYDGVLKELIRRYKYERLKQAHEDLAQILLQNSPYLTGDVVITNVPTATLRQRVRGYDHAELIAKQFAKISNLPHIKTLQRLTQHQQVGANKATRREQLQGAFRPINRQVIAGSHIVIIDDVITTGATLEECAKVLYDNGAASVAGLVVAKK